jgi:amino acid transporter
LAVVWPTLASNGPLAALDGIAAIWLLTFANMLGVRQGATIQLVTTMLKFVPSATIPAEEVHDPEHTIPRAPIAIRADV